MSGENVLVVMEDAPMGVLATELLLHDGYHVVEARSGEEALEIAFAEPPDLVLMSLRLRDMDGFTAVRRLRDDPRTRFIGVIGATDDVPDQSASKSAGLDALITQPFTIESFRELCRRVLDDAAARKPDAEAP